MTIALIMVTAISSVFGKDKERASKHTTVSSGNISITYGQPMKKGREIFGALVPYGQVWRTGADEATEITFKKDCMFADKPVKAGTYSLFTIPGKKEWGVILNSELKQWGAYGYDKAKDKDVLKATVPAGETDHMVETFTISIKEEGVLLEWDKTFVLIPVRK